jgi:hypothetical protein
MSIIHYVLQHKEKCRVKELTCLALFGHLDEQVACARGGRGRGLAASGEAATCPGASCRRCQPPEEGSPSVPAGVPELLRCCGWAELRGKLRRGQSSAPTREAAALRGTM